MKLNEDRKASAMFHNLKFVDGINSLEMLIVKIIVIFSSLPFFEAKIRPKVKGEL